MKRILLFLCVLAVAGTAPLRSETVAYWNFNTLFITTAGAPGMGSVPATIPASFTVSGVTATISLTNFTGAVDDFGGSDLNAQPGSAAEESLSLIGSAGNNSYIELQLDFTEFADPIVSFATRGTSTGFNSGIWSYSVGGGAFTDIGPNTASTSTTTRLLRSLISARRML
ncbi:MAG: hypothetical protein HC841_05130 [Verrucomicrobiae bacterium]|nr:hypothetical protein [Verrucomicrobiae bacterium]